MNAFIDHPNAPSGLAWPLAALQQKLEWERDAAQARLALLRQAHAQARAVLAQARRQALAQAAQAQRGLQASLDPAVHRHALACLTRAQAQLAELDGRVQRAAQAAEQARADGVLAQRRLQSLQAARERAGQAHAQSLRRRQARDADEAWLTRRPARGAP